MSLIQNINWDRNYIFNVAVWVLKNCSFAKDFCTRDVYSDVILDPVKNGNPHTMKLKSSRCVRASSDPMTLKAVIFHFDDLKKKKMSISAMLLG
jgi:hypothetical protein